MRSRLKPTLLFAGTVAILVTCLRKSGGDGAQAELLVANAEAAKPGDALVPYRNPRLPLMERVQDLLGRMTLAEKVAQLQSVNWDRTHVYDEKTRLFSPERARKLLPHGIGHVTRPGDRHDPREATELANALQRFLVQETRLGIPAILHEEGLHGFVAPGATSFPQAIALAATFDPPLVEEAFAVAARQMRARGVSQVLAPVLDVARDSRWGRIEETYGEDPFLVSRMGVAAVLGFQGRRASADAPIDAMHVMATAKHLTGHGQPEGGRNTAPAVVSPRLLREVFLPPFEAAFKEAGVQSVMASYNEVDGVPSHANRWMLTDLLRGEWGFPGLVVSDYSGVSDLERRHHVAEDLATAGRTALATGVDIELPEPEGYATLLADVKTGRLDGLLVDQAVRRVLRAKLLLGLFEHPYVDKASPEPERASDRALARRAAQEAIVLLKNEGNLLPIDPSRLKSIAVIGPNAAGCRLGGYSGAPDQTISVLAGIGARMAGRVKVLTAQGCGLTAGNRGWNDDEVRLSDPAQDRALIAEARKTAAEAELVILVIGQNEQLSREAWSPHHLGDRESLDLVGAQMELARAVMATGRPTVVLLIHGGPLSIPELARTAPAILDGFYLGEETGTAVADVLFGDVSPAGRLPLSVPRSVGATPAYYNRKPSADRQYLFEEAGPLWPFGHGLGYTSFRYDRLSVTPTRITPDGRTRVSLTVTNTGKREADEVVQLYLRDEVASVTRPIKELKGFRRIHLRPGEAKRVELDLGPEQLALWNEQMKRVVERGVFQIMVGASSADIRQHGRLEVVAAR
jgi:beta-glucosidase